MRMLRLLVIVAATMNLYAAAAQDRPAPPPRPQAPDVTVTGKRERVDTVVPPRAMNSVYTGPGPEVSRFYFAFSERFAGCVLQRMPMDTQLLKGVLDARTNSVEQAADQRRLVQLHPECRDDLPIGRLRSVASLDKQIAPYDREYYDRGALYIKAINTFAPDLQLTGSQLADPAVQARFNARETALARFRRPHDRKFFQAAVCLTRLQPELALELVRTQDAARISRIETSMVDNARYCLGGAKKVYFDPIQFRFYVADALYRWAVAAQGTDTLIPTS